MYPPRLLIIFCVFTGAFYLFPGASFGAEAECWALNLEPDKSPTKVAKPNVRSKLQARIMRFDKDIDGTICEVDEATRTKSRGIIYGSISPGGAVSMVWRHDAGEAQLEGLFDDSKKTIAGKISGAQSGPFELTFIEQCSEDHKHAQLMRSHGLPWQERLSSPLVPIAMNNHIVSICDFEDKVGRLDKDTIESIRSLADELARSSCPSQAVNNAMCEEWFNLYLEVCQRYMERGNGDQLLRAYREFGNHMRKWNLGAKIDQARTWLEHRLAQVEFHSFFFPYTVTSISMSQNTPHHKCTVANLVKVEGSKEPAWLVSVHDDRAMVKSRSGNIRKVKLQSVSLLPHEYRFAEGDMVSLQDSDNRVVEGQIAYRSNGAYYVCVPGRWSRWMSEPELEPIAGSKLSQTDDGRK